jgi:DNA damage-binding protein 1
MAYVVPIHKASSIRHALKLHFMKPEEDSLVVALVTLIQRSASTNIG